MLVAPPYIKRPSENHDHNERELPIQPIHENEFTHRNGRTARMQAKGNAYLLLSKLEKQPQYIKTEIKLLNLDLNASKPIKPQFKTISISGGRKNKIIR